MQELINVVDSMKASPVENYVIAGLDSFLLTHGKVRLFENGRNHQDAITPHSHRFDFACLVLGGHVTNRVWTECDQEEGDFFESSTLTYEGEIGSHKRHRDGRSWWKCRDQKFEAGEVYSMRAEEVHSIQFSRGAKVLFFEGPEIAAESIIIEPVVGGRVISTYEQRDYMFLGNDL